MREILFRGKRKDNGEWVQGGITQTESWIAINIVNDYQGSMYEPPSCEVEDYDVIPETVGQYTGLTDKNGKKIFEGDIVKYKHITNFFENEELEEIGNENPERVTECNGVVKWLEKCGCFSPVPERYDCDDCWYSNGTYDFEVIGNIHDNPELLKAVIK